MIESVLSWLCAIVFYEFILVASVYFLLEPQPFTLLKYRYEYVGFIVDVPLLEFENIIVSAPAMKP